MSTTTEQIKERLSIVDIVSGYVKLERAGANFRARCPFHNEKTPSFFVSPVRNTYHCFGCAVSGDIFSFVQQFEGLDFHGSLKMLAERAGVPLTDEPREGADERTRLFTALESACSFFEQELAVSPAPRAYLARRGLTDASISYWRIGFVREGWQALRDSLTRQGFREYELERAGLIKRGESGGFYDRFRSRIMFPITDSAGRVVAFSGRIFGDAAADAEAAKYLNSPETELFHKSSILYGFDRAKQAIRKLRCAILVEGQMDLVLSHQAGFTNTVALSGTALTEAQCKLLKRLTDNLLIALDADSAGVAAASRSASAALALGMDVKVAALPAGKDPADLILEDREEWRRAVRSATHVIEFSLEMLEREHASDRRTFRRAAARSIVPFLAAMSSAVDRAHFTSLVAARLALPENAIVEEMTRYGLEQRMMPRGSEWAAAGEPSTAQGASPSTLVRTEKERLMRQLMSILFWFEEDNNAASVAPEFVADLRAACGGEEALGEWALRFSEDRGTLVFEAERTLGEHRERLAEEGKALLLRLRKAILGERYETALEAVRRSEEAGDSIGVQKATKECEEIRKALASLMSNV